MHSITVAYADPPYYGQGHRYPEHPEAHVWDDSDHYARFIENLSLDYPNGWMLSASSQSLRILLPMCPDEVRVLAWVKPFAAFKKNVNPAYAWEPILVVGGRSRSDDMTYMRDWAAESITLKKGLTGAKPENICYWLFDAMNLRPDDIFVDLFPGTGIVGKSWSQYVDQWPEHASLVNRVSYKWEMVKGIDRHADLPD